MEVISLYHFNLISMSITVTFMSPYAILLALIIIFAALREI